jgi:hypothetical protein
VSTSAYTRKARVLRTLENAGEHGATTGMLCQSHIGGVRFGGRIHELRQEGHQIRSRYLRPGSHLYWLVIE